MNIKGRVVMLLLRLYPSAWRREYGDELSHLLLTRPLGPGTVADVVGSGVRQRIRSTEPATARGLAMMLVIICGLAWNIAAPSPYGDASTEVLQPTTKTLPPITVKPLASVPYLLFLTACGCWLSLQNGSRVSESGMAAIRVCFIAGVPIMLAGTLVLFGVLGLTALGPGDAPTTFHEHGWTYTYYSADHALTTPQSIIVAPLFRLPESWLWGMVGGWLGKTRLFRRHRALLGEAEAR